MFSFCRKVRWFISDCSTAIQFLTMLVCHPNACCPIFSQTAAWNRPIFMASKFFVEKSKMLLQNVCPYRIWKITWDKLVRWHSPNATRIVLDKGTLSSLSGLAHSTHWCSSECQSFYSSYHLDDVIESEEKVYEKHKLILMFISTGL